jgi:hypothetical protein
VRHLGRRLGLGRLETSNGRAAEVVKLKAKGQGLRAITLYGETLTGLP